MVCSVRISRRRLSFLALPWTRCPSLCICICRLCLLLLLLLRNCVAGEIVEPTQLVIGLGSCDACCHDDVFACGVPSHIVEIAGLATECFLLARF